MSESDEAPKVSGHSAEAAAEIQRLKEADAKREQQRRKAARPILILVAGSLVFWLAWQAYISYLRSRVYESLDHEICQQNVEKLSDALMAYAREHDGALPAKSDLTELVDGGYVTESGDCWQCPGQHKKGATRATSSYVYTGAGQRTDSASAASTPILHDLDSNHADGWINVAFLDGHVAGYEAKSWAELCRLEGWKTPTNR